jgi:hypothetical protein
MLRQQEEEEEGRTGARDWLRCTAANGAAGALPLRSGGVRDVVLWSWAAAMLATAGRGQAWFLELAWALGAAMTLLTLLTARVRAPVQPTPLHM